jgi:hypothetical protein
MSTTEQIYADLAKEMSAALHPDLIPYLEESDGGWMMLRHPLVYQVPLFSNGSANAFYEQKSKDIDKALNAKNYKQFVWLFERPYRVDAFIKIADKLSDTDYWKLLSSLWVDTENQYAYVNQWKELLNSDRPYRHYMMNEEEEQLLRSLPDEVTIYRGCQSGLNETGLSWTLDKAKAKFFANRFGKNGIILEKKIPRSSIIAVLTGRNESEVIYEEVTK